MLYGLYTYVRGHAVSMCPGHKGRGAFALSGIRLQQQLPGECANGTI